jgi:hypothetical protein
MIAAVAAAFAAIALACGPEGNQGGGAAQPDSPAVKEVLRIFPSDRVYKTDDLTAAGMKVMNDYDVSGLEKAVSATHLVFNKIEYEARFYASHADAVQYGEPWADHVSGTDAVVTGPDVKWEEGASHRRLCSRAAGNPHSGCSYSARYGDYVIQGNMVLLCEGVDEEHSVAACNAVMTSIK